MIYRLEIRERTFREPVDLTSLARDISWSWARIGGCGDISFKVNSRYCRDVLFGANYNLRLYQRNQTTKAYDLKYQGRIENKSQQAGDSGEIVTITGFGYQSALSDRYVNATYTSQEISAIMKNVLDNYIVGYTDVTYDVGDIPSTGITLDSLDFNYASVLEVARTLAEIAGNIEWGVDENRKFFFKPRATTTGYRYPFGGKLTNLRVDYNSRQIKNNIIVVGGKVAGVQFVRTKSYAESISKFGTRDAVLQRSAIVTNAVADTLADSTNAIYGDAVQSASWKLQDEVFLEDTIPIPLFEVVSREVTYDEEYYDTFLYAGQPAFQIDRVTYSILPSGKLVLNVTAGRPAPNIVEKMGLINFQLEQLRQGA